MLEKYLIEIITIITIVTLLIIYLIIKKTQSKNLPSEEKIINKDDVVDKTHDVSETVPAKTIKEESSINSIKKVDAKISSTLKREVPSHGKITKDSFKEFSGKRILVAEDNLINQKVISGLLAGSGIELVMADDGQIALDILEQDDNFTIILMDAHMPRVDGFEATRTIRDNEKYNHIVVVALSGDTAVDDIRKMTEAGMQEHLEKPLKMGDLYNIIYSYTGKQKEKSSDKHEYVEVMITKELNGDKGLSTCGEDEEFYLEILNEFVQLYSDSTDKLVALMDKNHIKEADKLLLDIIGISANIGADPLKEIAKNLKIAIRDTEGKSYLSILEQYSKHLQALLIDIKNYKNL